MTDELADDDFEDDFDSDYGNIRFERIDAGRYMVAGALTINGVRHEGRVECRNPADGFQRLGEEIDALLTQEIGRAQMLANGGRDTVLDRGEEGEKEKAEGPRALIILGGDPERVCRGR
jgi:hypothetical protein